MDSLTQIVLGAAVGEVVLGKKIGNRAMLFGAVGGTIPDLDVLSNFVVDEMTALAFHRAISHSFFFAFTAPLVFAFLTHRLYSSGLYRRRGFKLYAMISWLIIYAIIAGIVSFLPVMVGGQISIVTVLVMVLIGVVLGIWLWKSYYGVELAAVDATWKDWYWLFFWSIFTHPLLDCCTAYGTQVFQPFSDYRVAFNNISVVDPIYTLPFLICLITASLLTRNSPRRRLFNYLGIALSSIYLLLTLANKMRVDRVMERSLVEQGIQYKRYMTSPTIFNNALWNCIAEGDSVYYRGLYSIFDREARIPQFMIMPKNRYLLKGYEEEKDVKTLQWFSNDYYNVIRRKDGQLQLNDLRFGVFGEKVTKETDYVFRFILKEKDGHIQANQARDDDISEDTFQLLWERIKGQ
ncbi:MAG: metal-dependent hydrolase [Bacteroidota bacterium]